MKPYHLDPVEFQRWLRDLLLTTVSKALLSNSKDQVYYNKRMGIEDNEQYITKELYDKLYPVVLSLPDDDIAVIGILYPFVRSLNISNVKTIFWDYFSHKRPHLDNLNRGDYNSRVFNTNSLSDADDLVNPPIDLEFMYKYIGPVTRSSLVIDTIINFSIAHYNGCNKVMVQGMPAYCTIINTELSTRFSGMYRLPDHTLVILEDI